MQPMSALALRSAARRAAWSFSRRGLASAATAAGDAEREKIAAMVQQEVRSQLRAEEAALARAERESVAALVQCEVRDRLREEELRTEAELRAFLRRHEQEQASGSGLWGSLDDWMKGVATVYRGIFIGATYVHLCYWWIMKP
ncbi:hypothetical protein PR202_gb27720 [Eleusine coracana subsp. coracana]|uniref:Uncharacterized protein n=1 Tax=Eleusine coracana subsp. coracana TaxID=191504 RepID=A0AAV5FWS7_ELECO|nr:hypothetical protein PR202_gb27720 [Eleusine coracana subsp. coracana]